MTIIAIILAATGTLALIAGITLAGIAWAARRHGEDSSDMSEVGLGLTLVGISGLATATGRPTLILFGLVIGLLGLGILLIAATFRPRSF